MTIILDKIPEDVLLEFIHYYTFLIHFEFKVTFLFLNIFFAFFQVFNVYLYGFTQGLLLIFELLHATVVRALNICLATIVASHIERWAIFQPMLSHFCNCVKEPVVFQIAIFVPLVFSRVVTCERDTAWLSPASVFMVWQTAILQAPLCVVRLAVCIATFLIFIPVQVLWFSSAFA